MSINTRLAEYIDAMSSMPIARILLLGFILRTLWVLLVPIIPISDSIAYDTFSKNIINHGTYGWTAVEPTSFWPVGTSAIYAIIYFIFGQSYTAIASFNILISLGIIYTTYKLGTLYFSQQIGNLAALLTAINPTLIFFCTILASELPFMLFTMAGVYFFHQSNNRLSAIAAAATCFAISYYIRSLTVTMVFICAFSGVFYLKQSISSQFFRLAICIVMIAVLASPWLVRNYSLYGSYSSMSSNGGVVFWMGNTPGSDGAFKELPAEVSEMNELQRNNHLKEEAISYIKAAPLTFIQNTIRKFYLFHSRETIGVTWNTKGIELRFGFDAIKYFKVLTQAFWLLCLFGSIIGLVIYFCQQSAIVSVANPAILFWLSSATIHAIIASQDRYHLSIFPFMVMYFGYMTIYIRNRIQQQRDANIEQ